MSKFTSVIDQLKEKRAILPLNCPSCGASVHPDEVKWVDKITVECKYCGKLIRGETT